MRLPLASSLAALGCALVAAAPARAVDCGRLPRGQNPTWQELDAEISRASAKHGVPTEIIKGVAYQESGCQQWRADGTFVHNVTDCGLGMMQLTGATAEAFDKDKLKDDWRYNLDAGVTVLRQKWDRAQRASEVGADPESRRVLENWYYPVAYYWGRRSEEYLRKIFGHMQRRPGVLQQLLRREVQVTIVSEALPGFTFGDRFRAFADGRIEDKDGKPHRVVTHAGTIGDEQTLAALDMALERARRAHERKQVKRAIQLLRQVTAADLDTGHKAEAQQLLDDLTRQGEAQLVEAERLRASGDVAGAQRVLRKVVRDWEELEALVTRARAALEALKAAGRAEPEAPEPPEPSPDD